MKTGNNIFDSVIQQDLCVGCGACLYSDNSGQIKMDWNKEGFLVPTITIDDTDKSLASIDVCPFNPKPESSVRTEDKLASIFLKEAPNYHKQVGRYYNTYAGYSEKYRLTSSSGGIATYVLDQLFERGLIDGVITVGEGAYNHYEYKLIREREDLLATSKTQYYPVSMAEALRELREFDGKVAVVGIGCFLKSVRLLQHYNPELRKKIAFTVGIICGGLKSKFFGEYLASKAGAENNEFSQPQFRIKDYNSTAGDYSFGCINKTGKEKQVKMRAVGDMWGSGMFKANACDFCDDVTTELADVSLGDAWLQPYIMDGKGANVVVTRSQLADDIITDGIENKTLNAEPLAFERFLASQQGSFNHRHSALGYRIKRTEKKGLQLPPKRHDKGKITHDFKWVQNQRMTVRKQSLVLWPKTSNAVSFDTGMKKEIDKLKNRTRIYHYVRAVKKKLGGK